MEVITMASTPQWMRWYKIHGHNGNQGPERFPHVHVNVGGEEASVNIDTCQYIAGENSIPHNHRQDVLKWVRDNQYELKEEWDSKSNPQGY